MKTKLTPRAVAVRGALLGSLRSKLAQDQKLKIADLNALVAPITAKGYKTQKAKLAQDIKAAFKGKLAQDANLDDIMDLLDNLDDGEGEGMEEDALPKKDPNAPDQPAQAPKLPNAKDEGDEVEDACAKDGDEAGKALLALLQAQNLPDDVMSQVAGLLEQLSTPKPAVDGFPPKKGAPVPAVPPQPLGKPAMDAAIKAAEQATITRMNGIRRAEEKVEPLVGKLQPGMESAEAVFKFALDSAHIETANIHPSAFEVLVDVLLDRADAPQPVGLIAMDKAAGDSYETQYHASRLKR